MAEYIEREKLTFHLAQELEFLGEPDSSHQPVAYGCVNGLKTALSYANDIPVADVVEVRHGHWKREDNDVCYWYVCSECKDEIPRNKYGGWSFPSYCPNCGAKMDGKGGAK